MDDQFDRKVYTIGWICALPLEFTAATAILDEHHPPLPQDELDENTYELGRVGHCNIAIACLPSGVYGTTSAATVATNMRRSFPSITVGLMVGIGGGVPLPSDIRLGDVVVSEPVGGVGGVLQYDFGKTVQKRRFVHTGVVNKPPNIFLGAIAKLKSEYSVASDNAIDNIITRILQNNNEPFRKLFARPSADSDRLFKAEYDHPDGGESCAQCDPSMAINRTPRSHKPHIHYGLIASGNQVMKHGITRDELGKEKKVLCFEMEAAGLMDELPSLIIRGICDYSDSHKNDIWQPYAALVAAAFAKDLLLRLPLRVNDSDEGDRAQRSIIPLPIAEGAVFGSYLDQHESECLDGTRADLLNHIAKWAEDPQGECILWLNGMAGIGKSTISRTIAKRFQTDGQLGASFFFKRGEGDRGNGALFFTTIAVQLAKHFRSVTSSIQKAIEIDPSISRKAFKEQFDKLIVQPFSGIKTPSHKSGLVVLVDALDECEGKEDIRVIIYLLGQLKHIKTIDLRVFLTSRSELPIRLGFKELPESTYQNLTINEAPEIEHDITLFLKHNLSRIQKNPEYYLPLDWPGDENIQKLVEMAVPLFIYAATLCRFIEDDNWHPEERIKTVMEYRASWQASQLDKTYLPILDQLIVNRDAEEREKLAREFIELVGTIVNLASPLSISSLGCLLSVPEIIIECRLRPLHSVLDVPKSRDLHAPVRTFHQSFRDFLLNPRLQGKSPFWVDEKEAHMRIASRCIELMSSPKGIKKNICSLKSPGILRSDIDRSIIDHYLPSELQYACRYWVYHLSQSGYRISDNGQEHSFLQQHFLHWLEAMSLLDHMREVIQMIDTLSSISDNGEGKIVSAFIHDAMRFLLQNQWIISRAPLQTYISAVIFSPRASIVRSTFEAENGGVIHWISRPPKVQNDWDAILQTLEGHEYEVNAVTFSPDGRVLASASLDGTIRLWDARTGELQQIFEVPITYVQAIPFSSDSRVLASAFMDGTIKLWDAQTGELQRTLKGCRDYLQVLAFSPDDKILASVGDDSNTIMLRDMCTGELQWMLEGHTSGIHAVMFSPDSRVLASASFDNDIRLWSTNSGELQHILKGHTRPVTAVAFSPDGVLASASWDKTVRLWDARTGELHQILKGHIDIVADVKFSPNGGVLASASYDQTIKLWNSCTGEPQQTLRGHTLIVRALAFSPDGKVLASASEDHTIKLWDACSREPHQALEYQNWVEYLAFSSDGRILASASFDGTIRLWDASTEELQWTLEGHTEKIKTLKFSPNGWVLASASSDGIVRLWDARTGELQCMLEGHTKSVRIVEFSPDGRVLASASGDGTMRLWNLCSRELQRTLRSRFLDTKALAFSSDSRVLASVSHDETIRLWNVRTGELQRTFEEHAKGIYDVVFSPNGEVLASASDDNTFRLWDIRTGKMQQIFEGHMRGQVPSWAVDPARIELRRDGWLSRKCENLLFSPHAYRPSCIARHGNLIVLGHPSGKITFIEFDFDRQAPLI